MFAFGDLCRQMMVGKPFEVNTAITIGIIKNLDNLEKLSIERLANCSNTSVSSVKRFISDMQFQSFGSFISKLKSEHELDDIHSWTDSFSFDISQKYDLSLISPTSFIFDTATAILKAKDVFIFNDTVHPVSHTMVESILHKVPCYNFINLQAQKDMIKLINKDSFSLYFHSLASANDQYFVDLMKNIKETGCKLCVITESECEKYLSESDYKIIFDAKFVIDHFYHLMLIDLKLAQLLFDMRASSYNNN